MGGSLLENKEKPTAALLNEGINQGISSFSADGLYEMIDKNVSLAKKLVGERLLRIVTGYDPEYLEKNIRIPEFKKQIQKNIATTIQKAKEMGYLDDEGAFTQKGIELVGMHLYLEELDKLLSHGNTLGEKRSKQQGRVGNSDTTRHFKQGDPFSVINPKKSVQEAIKKNINQITKQELIVDIKKAKSTIEIIYALDCSGSMKGKKIEMGKKAGIALAYHAFEQKNRVGLVLFNDEVIESLPPRTPFLELLRKIVKAKPLHQTDIKKAIQTASLLFKNNDAKKHLLLISDLEPTVGNIPEEETLLEIEKLTAKGISLTFIGISLSLEAELFAKKIQSITGTKHYLVKELESLDTIVLEDYWQL
ncbi:MAG: VWA domain-containing protein [Candidatus Woesearchaeota archaeon]